MLLTVSTLPKTRRHLSADGLLTLIKERFQKIPDPRQNPVIPLCDALLSGLAVFALKDPSLLAFDERRHERNLRALFGIEQVPCDTQLREILDGVDPEEIRAAFADARAAIPFGRLAKHSIDEQELYHLAPSIAVKYRSLSADEEKLEQATNAAISSYMANIDVEREVLSDPRLAFAFCYLASHYGLGLVGIATLEEVMAVMEFNREQIEVSDDHPEQPGIL